MAKVLLNAKERMAIDFLKRLASVWPKSLWLFSADGSLWVMRYHKNGTRAITVTGGMDQEYIVTKVEGIPNDGGDW